MRTFPANFHFWMNYSLRHFSILCTTNICSGTATFVEIWRPHNLFHHPLPLSPEKAEKYGPRNESPGRAGTVTKVKWQTACYCYSPTSLAWHSPWRGRLKTHNTPALLWLCCWCWLCSYWSYLVSQEERLLFIMLNEPTSKAQ